MILSDATPVAQAWPHPVLLADIGGTNVRVARCEAPGAPPRILARLKTADHADAVSALLAVLPEGPPPRSALICGAGPVEGRRLTLTNCPWQLDGEQLTEALGVEQGLLLNDFEALALSLPALGPGLVEAIGLQLPPGNGPRLVIGPGTGLGVGALVAVGSRVMALPSEACHIGLAAPDDECAAVLARHARLHGRLSAEAVLSGPGLPRLHRARIGPLAGKHQDAASLVAEALADPTGEAGATVRLFLRLLAAFAGDMALTFAATGGVFLGGGILPRLRPLLEAGPFRTAFERKEPVDGLVRRTPLHLITTTDAVLTGMAAIAAAPDRYILDDPERLWRGP